MSAVLFLGLAACPGEDTDEPGPSVTLVAEALPSALLSIQGTANNDVWSVGSDAGGGDGPLILHYDGAGWETIASGAAGDLWWVHPTATRVTMVGFELILELDRSNGQITPHAAPEGITFFGVWGASPDDVWAVGGDPAGDHRPAVWHRDATGWSAFPAPALDELADADMLFKVHGASATDVWIVGSNGVVLHWDGSELARVQTTTTSSLFTVHAGGDVPVAVGGFNQATVLHYESGSWVDHSPRFTPRLNGVSGRGDTLVAVGQQGSVVRWDGSEWVADPVPATPLELHGTWIDDAGGVWAVGGAIQRYPMVDGLIGYDGPAAVPGVGEP